MSNPLRASIQAITEFEVHLSPVPSSFRPRTGSEPARPGRARAAAVFGVAQSPGVHGLGDVGDAAIPPEADLVAGACSMTNVPSGPLDLEGGVAEIALARCLVTR